MRWMLVACAVLGGCHRDLSSDNDGGLDAGDGRTLLVEVPVTVNRDVDILFVIDDSPGMLDAQTNLKSNFPNFINVLNATLGGLPNIHLGVVSSDLGAKGAEDASAGPSIGSGPGSCSGNGKSGTLQTNGSTLVSGTFISDIQAVDGSRTVNYDSTAGLSAAFSSIASLGAGGCGFEQPIEAAKRALNNNPANAGFLRPSANLAVVIVSDEDDCSMSHSTLLGSDTNTLGPLQSFRCTQFGVTCSKGGADSNAMGTVGDKSGCHSNEQSSYLESIANYKTFFSGLKSDPRQVYVGAIVGSRTPVSVELRTPPGGGTAIPALAHSCSYNGANGPEVADPAVRISDFATSFSRNSISSICQQDLSTALTETALKIKQMVGDPCLPVSLPANADCIVDEIMNAGKANEHTAELPRCDTASPPCWTLETDVMNCVAEPHQKLVVQRTSAPAPDTVVTMRCRL